MCLSVVNELSDQIQDANWKILASAPVRQQNGDKHAAHNISTGRQSLLGHTLPCPAPPYPIINELKDQIQDVNWKILASAPVRQQNGDKHAAHNISTGRQSLLGHTLPCPAPPYPIINELKDQIQDVNWKILASAPVRQQNGDKHAAHNISTGRQSLLGHTLPCPAPPYPIINELKDQIQDVNWKILASAPVRQQNGDKHAAHNISTGRQSLLGPSPCPALPRPTLLSMN